MAPIPSTPRPDLCVIGGGTAGHALAIAAAALGARCTLIDRRDRLGAGHAADLAESLFFDAAHAQTPGAAFDVAGFRRRLGLALARAGADHTAARLRTLGVDLILGEARFDGPTSVVVGDRRVAARRFAIATGTDPGQPAWMARLAGRRLLHPADLLSGEPLPPRVTIVAETAAGLEWAQALARLGTAVQLIAAPDATACFDREMLAPLWPMFVADGVSLHLDADLSTVSFDRRHPILVLPRPVPATAGLDLQAAGISSVDAAPVVDRAFRTSNRRVHALGDVLGRQQPGGGAIPSMTGLVLRAILFRQPVRDELSQYPLLLRTCPPLAQVGAMGPQPGEATRRVARFPLADRPGGVTLAADRRGRLRGAAVLGAGAAEAVATLAQAIAFGATTTTLAGQPALPGTLADAARRAALSDVAARLRGPWIKRLIAALRHLP